MHCRVLEPINEVSVGVSVPCCEHSNQDAVLIASQMEGLLKSRHLMYMSECRAVSLMYDKYTYAFAKADRSARCESAEP